MKTDALMSRYWLERERRERGEHTGLKAIAPLLSGIVSECCQAKVSPNRVGELVCTTCNGVCIGQAWAAARAESQQGDGYRTMYINETRTIDRDQQTRLRVKEADRYLTFDALADLIEPRPRNKAQSRWDYLLHAYGWFLTCGAAETERRGLARMPKAGGWNEWSIRLAVVQTREILSRRTNSRGGIYRYHLALDRASEAISV